jgi:hypothetical protein
MNNKLQGTGCQIILLAKMLNAVAGRVYTRISILANVNFEISIKEVIIMLISFVVTGAPWDERRFAIKSGYVKEG